MVFLSAATAYADGDDDIPTERPSFSTGTKTCPPGAMVIQTGGQFASSHSNPNALYTLPTGVRLGIRKDLELRAEGDTITLQGLDHGFADMAFGAKWNFFHKKNISLGCIAEIKAPTGTKSLREIGCMPVIGLGFDTPNPVLGWQPQLSVTLTTPVDQNDSSCRRFGQLGWASSFTRSVTKKTQCFFEFAGYGPTCRGTDGRCPVFVDGGVSYQVNKHLVVDGMVAHGFNHNDSGLLATVGMTYYLPDVFGKVRSSTRLAKRPAMGVQVAAKAPNTSDGSAAAGAKDPKSVVPAVATPGATGAPAAPDAATPAPAAKTTITL